MNAKERLQIFAKYKNISRNRFEELVGISSGYLSTKSPSVGSEIIEQITSVYPDLNIEWVVTGAGKMIKSPYRQEINGIEEFSYMKLVHVPLVSQYAQAEYLNRLDNKSYIDTLPTLPIIAEHEGKGSYICFEVRGDSMNDGSDNSFISGDILICREIDSAFYHNRLVFNKGKSFVIIHETEGIIVKQIMAHNMENGYITVHSLNPLYEDKRIDLPKVKKLFNVLKLQRIIMNG